MSKVDQLVALRAAGFDVPRTIAVAGSAELAAAARKLPAPFVSKHNQGGKGLGVRLFVNHDEFDDYLAGPEYEAPVDGITLLQEYLVAAQPRITRAEIVGGEFIYAITADTARGGFQLCPADACAVPPPGEPAGESPAEEPSLFALREGFEHPITGRYARVRRGGTGSRSRASSSSRPPTAAWSPTTSTPPRTTTPPSRRPPRARPAGRGPLPEQAARRLTSEEHDAVRLLDADLRRLAAQRQGRGHARRLAVRARPGGRERAARVRAEPDR